MSSINQCSFVGRVNTEPKFQAGRFGERLQFILLIQEIKINRATGERFKPIYTYIPVIVGNTRLADNLLDSGLQKDAMVMVQGKVINVDDGLGGNRLAILGTYISALQELKKSDYYEDEDDLPPKREVAGAPALLSSKPFQKLGNKNLP